MQKLELLMLESITVERGEILFHMLVKEVLEFGTVIRSMNNQGDSHGRQDSALAWDFTKAFNDEIPQYRENSKHIAGKLLGIAMSYPEKDCFKCSTRQMGSVVELITRFAKTLEIINAAQYARIKAENELEIELTNLAKKEVKQK